MESTYKPTNGDRFLGLEAILTTQLTLGRSLSFEERVDLMIDRVPAITNSEDAAVLVSAVEEFISKCSN